MKPLRCSLPIHQNPSNPRHRSADCLLLHLTALRNLGGLVIGFPHFLWSLKSQISALAAPVIQSSWLLQMLLPRRHTHSTFHLKGQKIATNSKYKNIPEVAETSQVPRVEKLGKFPQSDSLHHGLPESDDSLATWYIGDLGQLFNFLDHICKMHLSLQDGVSFQEGCVFESLSTE